jgi:hypothetical protein
MGMYSCQEESHTLRLWESAIRWGLLSNEKTEKLLLWQWVDDCHEEHALADIEVAFKSQGFSCNLRVLQPTEEMSWSSEAEMRGKDTFQ